MQRTAIQRNLVGHIFRRRGAQTRLAALEAQRTGIHNIFSGEHGVNRRQHEHSIAHLSQIGRALNRIGQCQAIRIHTDGRRRLHINILRISIRAGQTAQRTAGGDTIAVKIHALGNRETALQFQCRARCHTACMSNAAASTAQRIRIRRTKNALAHERQAAVDIGVCAGEHHRTGSALDQGGGRAAVTNLAADGQSRPALHHLNFAGARIQNSKVFGRLPCRARIAQHAFIIG